MMNESLKRWNRWAAYKIMFEQELEKFLSHCPNMTSEDDMRDLCEGRCDMYGYCISIEPNFDHLGGSEKNE